MLAGTIIGIVGAIQAIRSIGQIAETSESFGLTALSEESTNKVRNRIRKLLTDRVLLSHCYFKSLDGIDVVLGELSITPLQTTGTAMSRNTKPSTWQTCIYFQAKGFTFPAFELKPDTIRQLFSREVREKFEAHLGYCAIARDGQIILFKPNCICRKDQYESFVSMGMEIISVLQKAAAK